jgi:hypothetical protein
MALKPLTFLPAPDPEGSLFDLRLRYAALQRAAQALGMPKKAGENLHYLLKYVHRVPSHQPLHLGHLCRPPDPERRAKWLRMFNAANRQQIDDLATTLRHHYGIEGDTPDDWRPRPSKRLPPAG